MNLTELEKLHIRHRINKNREEIQKYLSSNYPIYIIELNINRLNNLNENLIEMIKP